MNSGCHPFERSEQVTIWGQIRETVTETSGQDGGIGRYGLPPHTTTSKLQLNYKTTITQNHQKSS